MSTLKLGHRTPTRLAPRARRPYLSVVVPLYNEEASIGPLHERLDEELKLLGITYEIVFVDDGSRDQSAFRLKKIVERDPNVCVVRFRRNYGQTAALQAGIEHSRGDVLVFMDADLQHDPADIPLLLAKLDEGYDVVSGWRKERHDDLGRRLPSKIANSLISWVTGVHLHDYGCTLKAYRREVLEPVKLYGEMHRFIPAYAAWAGASIVEIPVRHHARQFGRSKYGITRTARVLLDLMTVKMLSSYATKPIYFFGFVGFACWLGALASFAVVVLQKLFPPHVWAHNNPLLLFAALLVIVGVQFILMGLLAELSIRTYHESQDKPTYVVRQVLERRRVEPE